MAVINEVFASAEWLRTNLHVPLLRFAEALNVSVKSTTSVDKLKEIPVSGDALAGRSKLWREYDRDEPASKRGEMIWRCL